MNFFTGKYENKEISINLDKVESVDWTLSPDKKQLIFATVFINGSKSYFDFTDKDLLESLYEKITGGIFVPALDNIDSVDY